ncbi:uncharacterized protein [Manis javanica]|uniref:uncharacterized protein n=1 Tax=Manis javanica TaxID=9974 RepID=UPI003C6D27DB
MKYLHVTIDIFSGFIFASPLTGEASKDVITHTLRCFTVLGKPKIIKTNNGPGYTGAKFQCFCSDFQIKHITGIPYNPQGQGIVERAHQTLKNMLSRLKNNPLMYTTISPHNQLSHALFVINLLTLDSHACSAADRLWHPKTNELQALVKWKDPLTFTWEGPDPVIIWGRGSVCIYDQQNSETQWLLERLVKSANSPPSRRESLRLRQILLPLQMQSPTILVLLITTTVLSHQPAPPPAKSQHFPWNYTWIVLSERGDVVWSRCQTSPDVWWPKVLQPDLCKLALSAGAPWGVEHLFEQSEALFILRAGLAYPGCSNPGHRSVLRSYPFYVCPRQHRPRHLLHKCGGKTDYYCASWGCETTGDTYWKPSSSWDFITVKANYSHNPFEGHKYPEILPKCKPENRAKGWCNPLSITLTEKGTQASNWAQEYT